MTVLFPDCIMRIQSHGFEVLTLGCSEHTVVRVAAVSHCLAVFAKD
jgi:hypothetical protein